MITQQSMMDIEDIKQEFLDKTITVRDIWAFIIHEENLIKQSLNSSLHYKDGAIKAFGELKWFVMRHVLPYSLFETADAPELIQSLYNANVRGLI